MTHEILSGHPRIVEADQRRADLAAAESAHRDRAARVLAAHRERVAEWRRAQRAAVLSGEEPPPPPDEPPADDTGHILIEERQRLAAERRRVLAEIEPEIVADAMAREDELLELARPLVDQLTELAGELAQLHAAVRDVRVAGDAQADERPVPPRAQRMRQVVDVAALVEITQSGRSVLALAPPPGPTIEVESASEPSTSVPQPMPVRGVSL